MEAYFDLVLLRNVVKEIEEAGLTINRELFPEIFSVIDHFE